MGRNVDDYPGFQSMRSWVNTYAQDCTIQEKLYGTAWAYNSMYHKKIATFVKLMVGNVPSVFLKESFTNYVNKKKGEGVNRKSTLGHHCWFLEP